MNRLHGTRDFYTDKLGHLQGQPLPLPNVGEQFSAVEVVSYEV